jgi:CrcB protein
MAGDHSGAQPAVQYAGCSRGSRTVDVLVVLISRQEECAGMRIAGRDPREVAAIFAGGAIGTAVRAAIGELASGDPTSWPWPTFAVNVAGAFLLGYFTTRLQERLPPSRYRRPMLGTGLCGGLTTFSTMQVEIVGMLAHHAYGLAVGYAAASVAGGFAAVAVATALVRRVRVVA